MHELGGRMLNRIKEEKKEGMRAGNPPDFWSGTSELSLRMMTCEDNITLISQWFTLKMIIFWGFCVNGKAPLGHIIMHVIASYLCI